jgi:H+/Cl- antiporter ClcA
MTSSNPAPGWYPANEPGLERYWDGGAWTADTRPLPAATQAFLPRAESKPSKLKGHKRLGFLPDWRIFTYVILLFNLIMLIWVIAGASSGSGTPSDCGSLDAETCNNAQNAGTAIGVALLIVLWVLVDIILAIAWLITNRSSGRSCPVCGHNVKKGVMQCKSCGYDYRAQLQAS